MIETALCYFGFISVYGLAGHIHRLGLPLLELLPWPHLLTFIAPENIQRLAQTVFHAGVVTSQIGNAFACRTFKAHNRQQGWISNPVLLLGVAVELLVIAALIYIPPLALAFDHVALPLRFWPVLILFAPVLYILEWIRKALVRRIGKLPEAHLS